MIFVITGMGTKGFNRLVEKMDEIAEIIDEEVIIQIGTAKYIPKNAQYFDFRDTEEVRRLIQEARIVVCHGGAGTLISSLEQGKRIIAVPRLRRYNEAPNDHQQELVEALVNDGRIKAVYDVEDIMKAITSPFTISKKVLPDKRLAWALKEYIQGLSIK